MTAQRPQVLRLCLLLAAAFAAGCASSGEQDSGKQPVPIKAWSPGMLDIDKAPGILLLEIDLSLKAWNKLFLTAKDQSDAQKARALEESLAYQATRHQGLLIDQLESGPPKNRQVAALALGFSRDVSLPSDANTPGVTERVDPLGALLAALQDPEALVAANAAFAIGILARSETPTGGLVEMLERSPEPKGRTNAAWALYKVLAAGADSAGVVAPARRGLTDTEPAVRATCCLILAQVMDLESIEDMALVLYDDENHPAVAASRALAYMGSRDEHARGPCARALTRCLPRVRNLVRRRVLAVLQRLAKANYPDDEEWIKWAHGLG